MKKGLRLVSCNLLSSQDDFNRRPDEEGIKTGPRGEGGQDVRISTADLMKKGLRRDVGTSVRSGFYFNRRPDEEGIKTCRR